MVNKVILIGNLGRDPETRYTPNGKAVTRFSLATSSRWVNADGEKQEATDWHNVVVWGKQGEACGQYLQKGRQVYVEGSLRYREYDDQQGNKRHVTEIIAQKVRFLGSATNGHSAQSPKENPPVQADDDIPF